MRNFLFSFFLCFKIPQRKETKPEKRKGPVGFEEQNMYCCPPKFGFEKIEVLEKATAFVLGINFP